MSTVPLIKVRVLINRILILLIFLTLDLTLNWKLVSALMWVFCLLAYLLVYVTQIRSVLANQSFRLKYLAVSFVIYLVLISPFS
jgi:hypothetical protein